MKLSQNYVVDHVTNSMERVQHMFIGTEGRAHLLGSLQLVGGRSLFIQLHTWANARPFHFISTPMDFEEMRKPIKHLLNVVCNNKDEMEYFTCRTAGGSLELLVKFKGRLKSTLMHFVPVAIDEDAEIIIFMEEMAHEAWSKS